MSAAFFLRRGDRDYLATEAGHGPWSDQQLHGGAVAALLTRVAEEAAPDGGHVARFAMDFLRPVPVGPLTTTVQTAKPGRAAVLLEATLHAASEPLARAFVWWRRLDAGSVPAVPLEPLPLPRPDALPDVEPHDDLSRFLDRGYVASMRWRLEGGLWERGPAATWARPRIPLVADEAPASPTQELLLLADCASGVSAELDFRTHLFTNLDLVVTLLRPPVAGWMAMQARTAIDPAGGGICSTRLGDEQGPVGTASQSLVVRPHAR